MLGTIILKEIRDHILSFRFSVTSVLFLVLMVGSFQLMVASYQRQLREYGYEEAQRRSEIKELENSRDLRYRGLSAARPPEKLSVLALGLEASLSRPLHASRWRGVELGEPRQANPLFHLYASPDLVYIVNVVLSLLAILFTFDSVCGEKETGTLRLCLSNPVPRDKFLLGKWLGGYACLVAPLIVAVLMSIATAQLVWGFWLNAEEWARLGVLVGLSLLYLSVFFNLGLFISTLTMRSNTALVVSLFVWVILVLGLPNLVPIVARQLVRVPSAAEVYGALETIDREERARERKLREGVTDSAKRDEIRQERRERTAQRAKEVLEGRRRALLLQTQVAQYMSRLSSPSASFVYAATELTRTGISGYWRYQESVDAFDKAYAQAIEVVRARERKISRRDQASRSVRQVTRETESTIREEDLPKLQVPKPSLAASLHQGLIDWFVLAVYNVIFFLGGFFKFLRYDVT